MSFAQALAGLVPKNAFNSYDMKKLSDRRREVPRLAIDQLLPDDSKYPPRKHDDFTKLIASIETSDTSKAAKIRVLYYLFLDCGPDFAQHYAKEVWISPAQKLLVEGLRRLDRREVGPDTVGAVGGAWDEELPNDEARRICLYIVSALAPWPEYVVAFVDAKELAYEVIPPYTQALVAIGAFNRALAFKRELKDNGVLRLMAQAASTDKQKARLLANLPFTAAEWDVIADALEPLISQDAMSLAGKLSMVRALHMGDLSTVNRLKALDPQYGLLSQGVGDL